MIPILYQLRESIRFEYRDGFCLVISEAPLNVVQASKRAVRILQLCDGKRTVADIAGGIGIAEEQVFKICDYFNKKAVLETHVFENNGYFPSITVVIPTRDRAESVTECLESIKAQEYPSNRIEIIVVDDGSLDETQKLVSAFTCTLLTNPSSQGQSFCRNIAARRAQGEIIAFLDDDCVASRTWLKDLIPYFQWEKVGAVGGFVDGYSNKSQLDRYEKKFSLLNLGPCILQGVKDQSAFFVPTCNALVRKRAFDDAGGIRETMHLGEDVDFCWRMRDAGWIALYVPSGSVMHKHRNTLGKMLRRRADYGTSEAALCMLHPQKRKILEWRALATAAFLGLCLSLILLNFYPLVATGIAISGEASAKAFRLHRKRIQISFGKICLSVLRTYVSYFYRISFHLIRYYLVLLLLLGFALRSLWGLAAFLLIYSALVDYSAKRPLLTFHSFFVYYVLDQISYQIGVLIGCIRAKNFRTYLVGRGIRRVRG